MTLPDLCEPVFLSLCRLSRRHRAGDAPTSRRVREELSGLLVDLRAQAALSPALLSQFERTEPAIILCIDHALRTSGWPCAKSWFPRTRAAIAPDDDAARFYALLQQNLEDPSQAADERLEVFASCAALAFSTTGLSEAHAATLEQLRLRLAIESPTALWPRPRIITDDLTRPSPRVAIAAVAIGLAAIAGFAAASSFRSGKVRPPVPAVGGGAVTSAEAPP